MHVHQTNHFCLCISSEQPNQVTKRRGELKRLFSER